MNLQTVEEPVSEEYQTQNNKIGKLLYYFENRDLYLSCKMYYGAIFLMFRLAFFVLIATGDSIDCLLSLISLIYLCYYWYSSLLEPIQGIKSINKLAVILITVKYLIGCIDIQLAASKQKLINFEPSLILIFLGTRSNKNYYFFDILISKSLQDYWLVSECMFFVAIQLIIYFYTVILQLDSEVISSHIKKIMYMIRQYIHYNLSVMTNKPLYVNFDRWFSPKSKYAEMFLKIGTIYLPIVAILILLRYA